MCLTKIKGFLRKRREEKKKSGTGSPRVQSNQKESEREKSNYTRIQVNSFPTVLQWTSSLTGTLIVSKKEGPVQPKKLIQI